MAIVKEVPLERKEKEELEKKEEKKPTWFQKVPAVWKLGGIAIIFIKYQMIVKSKGNLNEIWVWIIAVLLIWYFLGTEGRRREGSILTPEEAEWALQTELVRKIRAGQISRWSQVYVGPNNGLFHHEGLPVHYQIGLEIVDHRGRQYKKGIVYAVGDTKGYATISESEGMYDGIKPIPIISALPNWLKRGRKFDLDLDKVLFGEKRL